MGIFNKKKSDNKVLKQDLTKTDDNNLFIMRLLMKERCEMPSKERIIEVIKKYLGDVECFYYTQKNALFVPEKYKSGSNNSIIYPQLMINECIDTNDYKIDELTRSQMWECKNSDEILSECKYQVVANEILASGMDYKQRAEMLMDYMEALVEIYPECVAIQFLTSGKMLAREQIVDHKIPREERFVHFAVNVRFFNIQDSDDKIVDTLGMGILGLPDLQYHFHNVDFNYIMDHAYNIASYIFENNNPIKDNNYVDGIKDGEINMDINWRCHYEKSLIQPIRDVIDIHMNENASGKRD